jgi:putative endonuclease
MFYTYILYSLLHDRFYIGQTNNLDHRIQRHNNGQVLSTKPYRPWKIVYSKEFNTRADAMREEKKLKSFKNRKFLEQYCGLISERLLTPKRI